MSGPNPNQQPVARAPIVVAMLMLAPVLVLFTCISGLALAGVVAIAVSYSGPTRHAVGILVLASVVLPVTWFLWTMAHRMWDAFRGREVPNLISAAVMPWVAMGLGLLFVAAVVILVMKRQIAEAMLDLWMGLFFFMFGLRRFKQVRATKQAARQQAGYGPGQSPPR